VREAVIDGDGPPGGVLFDQLEPAALADSVRRAEDLAARGAFDPERLRERAERFSRERFRVAFASFLAREGGDALARALAPEAAVSC
jgi:hypothetical protein